MAMCHENEDLRALPLSWIKEKPNGIARKLAACPKALNQLPTKALYHLPAHLMLKHHTIARAKE